MSQVLGKGNYVVVKVNGSRQVLTSGEVQRLLDAGYDVEITRPR
jgi:hypothetical protein